MKKKLKEYGIKLIIKFKIEGVRWKWMGGNIFLNIKTVNI